MLEAVRYIEPVGTGVTKPHLLEASDGRRYIVKLSNNRLGVKALANEFIAARLGQMLELSFPASELINISAAALARLRPLRRLNTPSGLHFAVRYLSRSEYVRPWHIRCAINRRDFAGVILFDHIMQNEDRTLNRRNLLARQERQGIRLYAIDNTHIFGSGCWRRENLPQYQAVIRLNDRLAYGVLLRHYLQPQDFAPWLVKLRSLSPEHIASVMGELPPEWLSAADRAAAADHINGRLELAERIAAMLGDLAANKHRRAHRHQLK